MNTRCRNDVNVTGRDNAPLVLLTHGFGGDRNLWELDVPDLSQRCRPEVVTAFCRTDPAIALVFAGAR
ncbi:hypothetical protein [Lentzea sp.]|uniref:alpha/beta fold hydrolase n=1 Tax=Lentzea sp. TaxID=56099 RepID=UPI002ED2E9E8